MRVHRFASFALLMWIPLSLAACSGIANPDGAVTISQGIYNVAIVEDDTGSADKPYTTTFGVRPTRGGTTITVRSRGDGFFEQALEPDEYKICNTTCTVVRVAAGQRTRVDYTAGLGSSFSRCDLPTIAECVAQ